MTTLGHRPTDRWSIFCRVVDNFGDIGVCWRLARSLASHHGRHVTLWVDELAALQRLHPATSTELGAQQLEGVMVRRWQAPFDSVANDDVVIEAFACELPEEALLAMASRAEPPVWINLEYLSAESWVEACHRMPSPHPRLPLQRHFFFPGFTSATGGLLREPWLLAQRDDFLHEVADKRSMLSELLGHELPPDALCISLFSYEQPGLSDLLRAWSGSDRPVVVLVPEGRVMPDVARYFGRSRLELGEIVRQGNLQAGLIPFCPQNEYDRLLWACDLNFVRGEDSLVRANWAARPFVWHIYRQEDEAHLLKLDAFLQRFLADADPSMADAVARFWRAWNADGDIVSAWGAFSRVQPEFAQHCRQWSTHLAEQDDLATALVNFSETGV